MVWHFHMFCGHLNLFCELSGYGFCLLYWGLLFFSIISISSLNIMYINLLPSYLWKIFFNCMLIYAYAILIYTILNNCFNKVYIVSLFTIIYSFRVFFNALSLMLVLSFEILADDRKKSNNFIFFQVSLPITLAPFTNQSFVLCWYVRWSLSHVKNLLEFLSELFSWLHLSVLALVSDCLTYYIFIVDFNIW